MQCLLWEIFSILDVEMGKNSFATRYPVDWKMASEWPLETVGANWGAVGLRVVRLDKEMKGLCKPLL